MMFLAPVLMLLAAGWLLWLWIVSDHFEIAWLRKWCAILFTSAAVLISAGAGAGITRAMINTRHRQQVREFTQALERELSRGNAVAVLNQLRTVNRPPDEFSTDSRDLLSRMQAATEQLREPNSLARQPSTTTPVAARPGNENL